MKVKRNSFSIFLFLLGSLFALVEPLFSIPMEEHGRERGEEFSTPMTAAEQAAKARAAAKRRNSSQFDDSTRRGTRLCFDEEEADAGVLQNLDLINKGYDDKVGCTDDETSFSNVNTSTSQKEELSIQDRVRIMTPFFQRSKLSTNPAEVQSEQKPQLPKEEIKRGVIKKVEPIDVDDVEGWNYLTTGDPKYMNPYQALAVFRVAPENSENDERIFIIDENKKIIPVFLLQPDQRSAEVAAIKKQFILAMERFYGPEVTELILPQEARGAWIATSNPFTVAEASEVITRANEVGEKIRNYIQQYPEISAGFVEAINNYNELYPLAEHATLASQAAGSPWRNGLGVVKTATTTSMAIVSLATFCAGITMIPHHPISFTVACCSLGLGAYINNFAHLHRLTSCYFIGNSYRNFKEAKRKYKESRKAQELMLESTAQANRALVRATNLEKIQQKNKQSLSESIPWDLKNKIVASAAGVEVRKTWDLIQNAHDHLEKITKAECEKKMIEQKAARAAAERMDERVRLKKCMFF